MLKVELVYITSEHKLIQLVLELAPGATVSDALIRSGIYQSHPETKGLAIGIYAKQVALDTMLKTGDRIELYRPLALDPKETRRKKALLKKKAKT